MSDEPPAKAPDPGAPAWVMTFADLMSLLMCFFVLLLAFSEMDALKFKQLAGSMKMAFGVQRDVKAKEIPKGTSVIAKEFSPGKPDPTVLNQVRQQTTADLQRHLQVGDGGSADEGEGKSEERKPEDDSEQENSHDPSKPADPANPLESLQVIEVPVDVQAKADATALRRAFAEEITEGLLDVATDAQRVIIRIQEKGAFASGSAAMIVRFEPVIARIGEVVNQTSGRIIVAGHTDDIPISTARFRSNWELSAARSVTVVHHLAEVTGIDQRRFLIEGHADNQPLAPNNSSENRARNRRVEIIIVKGEDVEAGQLEAIPDGSRMNDDGQVTVEISTTGGTK